MWSMSTIVNKSMWIEDYTHSAAVHLRARNSANVTAQSCAASALYVHLVWNEHQKKKEKENSIYISGSQLVGSEMVTALFYANNKIKLPHNKICFQKKEKLLNVIGNASNQTLVFCCKLSLPFCIYMSLDKTSRIGCVTSTYS